MQQNKIKTASTISSMDAQTAAISVDKDSELRPAALTSPSLAVFYHHLHCCCICHFAPESPTAAAAAAAAHCLVFCCFLSAQLTTRDAKVKPPTGRHPSLERRGAARRRFVTHVHFDFFFFFCTPLTCSNTHAQAKHRQGCGDCVQGEAAGAGGPAVDQRWSGWVSSSGGGGLREEEAEC